MKTKNHTTSRCAKVKIEVDLITKLKQRVRIMEEDDITRDMKFKWVKVQYNYMPKYCRKCCLQGHDEHNCWTIHLELYDGKSDQEGKEEENKIEVIVWEQRRVLTRVVDFKHNKKKWMVRRINNTRGINVVTLKGKMT